MALTDYKITDADRNSVYVKSNVGDTLTGTVTENKDVFDKYPEKIREKHNSLVDALVSTADGNSGADGVKITPVTGRSATSVQEMVEELNDDSHTHANKALLDTYTQTEVDMADAVNKKHNHENKALLDTYTQTEANLSDAVTKKHSHTNNALLDTYTQTEVNLADAVSKKHQHSNKSVLDGITTTLVNKWNGLVSLFNGIASVVTSLGSDNTTIPTSKAVADAISSSGGGDMLKSSYDNTNTGNKVDKAIGDEDGTNIKSTYATKSELTGKVDKVNGKGLSTNDYTTAEKTKLGGIATSATANTVLDLTGVLTTTWAGTEAPYTQAVTVTGILATDMPIIDLIASDTFATAEAENTDWGKIYKSVTSANTITFYATEAPTVAMNFSVKVVRIDG